MMRESEAFMIGTRSFLFFIVNRWGYFEYNICKAKQ